VKIEGLEKVLSVLRSMAAKAQTDSSASVSVGYATAYALFVHENIQMKWKGLPRRPPAKGEYWGPKGQAKFLEQPARQNQGKIAEMVRKALQAKKTMAQALLIAGLWLQRISQLLVPVDSGTLKNSAFTRLDRT
jgi:hypothetical protein